MPDSVRILGIDPGSRNTGYALIDVVGTKAVVVTHGVFRLPRELELPDRLRTLDTALRELVREHQPDEVAVEEVFVAANVRSALVLGHARGVVIVATGSGCPVFEYSARAVKKAVVGYGQADKGQVGHMVKTLLQLPKIPPQDAADALALALCHMHCRSFAVRLQSAR